MWPIAAKILGLHRNFKQLVRRRISKVWGTMRSCKSMLVLIPEQVREVCKREEEERQKKEWRRRVKRERQKRRLASIEGMRAPNVNVRKSQLVEKHHLLSLWMKDVGILQNMKFNATNLGFIPEGDTFPNFMVRVD